MKPPLTPFALQTQPAILLRDGSGCELLEAVSGEALEVIWFWWSGKDFQFAAAVSDDVQDGWKRQSRAELGEHSFDDISH